MYQMKSSSIPLDPTREEDDEDNFDAPLVRRKDDDFQSIAYSALLKMLQDPVLLEYHMSCTQCITFITRDMGPHAKLYLNSVFSLVSNQI
jgi:Serine/threonine-protein kinase mTOR domain